MISAILSDVCDRTPAVEMRLAFEAIAVSKARRFVRATQCPVHHHPVDDAVLVVSELVTNGIRHGAPPITLTVECEGAVGLRVTVADAAGTNPQRVSPDAADENGRGLMLVDYISQAWGVKPTSDGKSIWVLL